MGEARDLKNVYSGTVVSLNTLLFVMQQYRLHLRVHYAVDLDSNSSFTYEEIESSDVT